MKNKNVELFLSEDFDLDLDKSGVPLSDDSAITDYSALLDDLDKIMSPILVKNELDQSISDQLMEACSEDNVLFERNIIRFDKDSRIAQLKAVCALLLARKKNTTSWQLFKKASNVKNKSKLLIQEEENVDANKLVEEYLNKIRTSGNSSLLRKAAENLSE